MAGKDILKSIMKGLGAVAPTVANLVLPGSGPMLHGLMRAVTGDDADRNIEEVAAKIQNDPKLMIELRKLAVEEEVGLARVEAAKLETVNKTMRVEAVSDKFSQYAWRPFNGFMFPIVMTLNYVVLPLFDKPPSHVPEMVLMGWLGILGVATYGRGKEKRARAGATSTGMLEGLISAIKS